MLNDLPVDVLKIDMAFLEQTENVKRCQAILKSIIQLSGELEIPVITEGVETAEQVSFLKQCGCNMFQGFYFAHPLEIATFEEKFMSEKA
jgi:EAL domain-containing protein (putative c-di-GMP-specific phosphodiesterase class I)